MTETPYSLDKVAIRMVKEPPLYSSTPVRSPDDAVRLMAEMLKGYDREVFCIVNFRNDMTPINMNIVSMGTLNASLVHPREILKSLLYGFECRGVNSGIAADNAGAGIYHMLGDIKDRHRNVECVRDQYDCHERLEYPFEEYPCLKVCKVVVIDDQLDQLIAGDEREDQARNGNDHRFRDIPHKTEYSG